MKVESTVIVLLSLCFSVYEHFVMSNIVVNRITLYDTYKSSKPLKLKRIKAHLKITDAVFIERKMDELVLLFGKRKCKSH